MLSPIIWTSIATGKHPEKHGITWFMVDSQKAGQRIPVTSTTRRCKALWNILSENDRSVGVVGWWATYPAEEVNGFIVSDHLAYHTFGVSGRTIQATFGKTYPRLLLDEVQLLIPDPTGIPYETVKRYIHVDEQTYIASASAGEKLNFINPISHFRQIYATCEGYRKISKKLFEEENPDLMAVYFEGVDSCEHLFMHCIPPKLEWTQEQEYTRYMDVVTEMYKKADEVVGELLESRDDNTTVILVSDHGFETGDERIQRKSGLDVATAHLQHKRDAVIIMNGPQIIPNKEIFGTTVLDITPMALYLLGLPVGEDMDGRVIDDAIDRDYLKKHPIETIATYEGGEGFEGREPAEEGVDEAISDEMVARLQSLGYIGTGGDGGVPAEIDGNMAQIKLAKGKLMEAAEEFEKALQKMPEASATRFELSQVYLQLGNLVKALEHGQIAARQEPNNEAYKFGLAGIYEAQNRYQEAAQIYNAILASSSKNADAISNLGNAAYRLGNAEEAKKLFDRALEVNPHHTNSWFNSGVYHEQKGEFDQAIECYEKTIETASRHVSAYVNMGNCYDKKDDLEEALRCYHEALALDKNHVPAHFNIGLINNRLGKHEQAAENFWKAIAINPDLADPHREFFFVSVRLNQMDKAAQAIDAWTRIEPDSPEAWFHKSRFFYATNRPEPGLVCLQRSIRIGGDGYVNRGLNDPLLSAAANQIAGASADSPSGESNATVTLEAGPKN
jgi:tetratricopeptide (TPR) repeat protein